MNKQKKKIVKIQRQVYRRPKGTAEEKLLERAKRGKRKGE